MREDRRGSGLLAVVRMGFNKYLLSYNIKTITIYNAIDACVYRLK